MLRAIVAVILTLGLTGLAIGVESDIWLEGGTESVVFGNLAESDEMLDGVVLRVAISHHLQSGLSIGPVLTWRFQPYRERWLPFAPPSGDRFERDDEHTGWGAAAHFWELTVRARLLSEQTGLHPFADFEAGLVAIEDVDSDFVLSFRGGAAWRSHSGFTVLLGVGHRLYVATPRLTAGVSLEAGACF